MRLAAAVIPTIGPLVIGVRVTSLRSCARSYPSSQRSRTVRTLMRRFLVDQLVDILAQPSAKVFDVEPSYRPRRAIMSVRVKAEVRRTRIFPRDDVILAGGDHPAAARTLVDDDGRLGHRHHCFTYGHQACAARAVVG